MAGKMVVWLAGMMVVEMAAKKETTRVEQMVGLMVGNWAAQKVAEMVV
jgi:hypothetical protein